MVSPYLLRRSRSLGEAAAQRAAQPAPPVDEAARQAVLDALGRLRALQPSPSERPQPQRARTLTRTTRSR